LIKGILPQTGVATIGGQSGTGKSFHAIHLGVCLIPDCRRHFYIDKYRIKRKGGVLYLVLEGKPAFPLRVTAAFEHMLNKQVEFGERFKLPFAWNTYAPNLFEKGPDNLLRLADREAKKMKNEFGVDLVAVFLDTMGLAACYENENMAAQVQKVVAGLSRVSDETGALSINVDHMGKDQDAGMRGCGGRVRNAIV
jgi:RecA-family ATPase